MEKQPAESFAHAAAKNVLCDWLMASHNPSSGICAAEVRIDGRTECCAWQPHRPRPFGIWQEYPWDPERHGSIVWDESPIGHVPDLAEYQRRFGCYPAAIWDVAIQHKGAISTAFEVIWKSPPTAGKREVIHSSGVVVYCVSARWILGQIGHPTTIQAMERIG